MTWEKVLNKQQLPPGAKQPVKVSGQPILLINHCDTVYAIASSCPHWGLPLELGRLTDDCGLICPWHRSAFDLPTGDIKAWAPWPPGLGRVIGATSRRKVLPTYATRVDDDGSIWVSLTPPEKASNGAAAAAEPANPAPDVPAPATAVEKAPGEAAPVLPPDKPSDSPASTP